MKYEMKKDIGSARLLIVNTTTGVTLGSAKDVDHAVKPLDALELRAVKEASIGLDN